MSPHTYPSRRAYVHGSLRLSGVAAAVIAVAAGLWAPAMADRVKLGLEADTSGAIGFGPRGIPIYAAGDSFPIEVYVSITDAEGDGFDNQGIAGVVWNLVTDTAIEQNRFAPSCTYDGRPARANHEVWLEAGDGAFFVGGFGFVIYDGGNIRTTGQVRGPGMVMGLLWYADVSPDAGLQPYALHGVGIGSPPGIDVGGTPVGSREKWYMMASRINVPLVDGFYTVEVAPSLINVIRPDVDLHDDVATGYQIGARNVVGDSFVFQAGSGTPPEGSPPTPVLRADPVFGDSPLTVRFDATDSYDLDGEIVSYEWDFGDGSAAATGPTPTHTYYEGGQFSARLWVVDDDYLSDVVEQIIAVDRDMPPVAQASADVVYGSAPLAVHFSGSASYDLQDEPLEYLWDFGDGSPPAFGESVVHTFNDYGVYTVALTVRDPADLVDSDTIEVTVENQPPYAVLEIEPAVGAVPLAVRFDAGGSHDPDGDRFACAWDFGDGYVALGVKTTHTYTAPGVYDVELRVVDDKGLERTVGRSVRALLPDGRVLVPTPNNRPPVAGVSAAPGRGSAPLTVTFKVSGSDPDGDAISFMLDTGAGAGLGDLAVGQSATYTYVEPGQYTAKATAFDGHGGSADARVVVTVGVGGDPSAGAALSGQAATRGWPCGAGVAGAAAVALTGLWMLGGVVGRRR